MTVPVILVSPLSQLDETLAQSGAQHLVSLLSVGAAFSRPSHLEAERCLHLVLHDIAEERDGFVAPAREHVAALLDFAGNWDRQTPLAVHCYAGISRSTAAAFCIAAALQPERNEAELARELRRLSPMATPNPRIVALADALLNREGRMIAAIRAIGRGADAFEGVPFTLRID